jgi:hypothetical protein
MSMKNSKDTIWNRTSDLPICSTVPMRYIGGKKRKKEDEGWELSAMNLVSLFTGLALH